MKGRASGPGRDPYGLPPLRLSKQISAAPVTCPNNSPSRHFPPPLAPAPREPAAMATDTTCGKGSRREREGGKKKKKRV